MPFSLRLPTARATVPRRRSAAAVYAAVVLTLAVRQSSGRMA